MDKMRGPVAEIRALETELLAQREAAISAAQSAMRRTLVGGGLIAAVLAVFMAYQLGRNISIPLSRAVGLARRVAQGDLTAEVKVRTGDEAGELMAALKDRNASLVSLVSNRRLAPCASRPAHCPAGGNLPAGAAGASAGLAAPVGQGGTAAQPPGGAPGEGPGAGRA